MILGTRARGAAVEEYGISIVDSYAISNLRYSVIVFLANPPASAYIVCDGFHRFGSTGKPFAVEADVLIRNTRVIEITSDNPVSVGVELPQNNISYICFDFIGCELMS